MKILSVSDFKDDYLEKNIESGKYSDVDIIISCGDLQPEFLSYLSDKLKKPLYYVLGNHDIRYKQSPPIGCVGIHGKIINVGNFRILGFSGSRWYNGGVNQYSEKRMKKIIKGMRFKLWRSGGVDIVVTHAPPRHVKDAEDRCHRGFKSYNSFIKKYNPAVFIHGHIHKYFNNDDERTTLIDSTRVINTCGHNIIEI